MSDFWSEQLSCHTPQPLLDGDIEAHTHLYPISDRKVLSIKGPDSGKFMQGQFTCQINDISLNQYRPGACCNAKGRMVNNFNLLQTGDHQYLLSLHASLAEPTQAHLKKYMVFFKSEMTTTDTVVAGIKGPNAAGILTDVFGQCPNEDYAQSAFEFGHIIKLPFNAGFELYLPATTAKEAVAKLTSKCSLTTKGTWNLNLIQNGLAQLTHSNIEKFIPQMLNLSEAGAVSFSKGCYTGQEIVARMEYLGKLKRHLYRGCIENCDALSAGDAIFTPGHDNPIGEVVNWAAHNGNLEALMVLEDKYLQNPLYVNSASGPHIQLLSLPYEISIKSA
jgi:folate-binding protein YgfZ